MSLFSLCAHQDFSEARSSALLPTRCGFTHEMRARCASRGSLILTNNIDKQGTAMPYASCSHRQSDDPYNLGCFFGDHIMIVLTQFTRQFHALL